MKGDGITIAIGMLPMRSVGISSDHDSEHETVFVGVTHGLFHVRGDFLLVHLRIKV